MVDIFAKVLRGLFSVESLNDKGVARRLRLWRSSRVKISPKVDGMLRRGAGAQFTMCDWLSGENGKYVVVEDGGQCGSFPLYGVLEK